MGIRGVFQFILKRSVPVAVPSQDEKISKMQSSTSQNVPDRNYTCSIISPHYSKLNPLDLPEIISCVGDFLDKSDIAKCLRISKSFHNALIESLWKRIHVRPHYRRPTEQALKKHGRYIEELVIEFKFPKGYMSLRGCSRLKHISVNLYPSRPVPNDLINLIRAHTVTKLSFNCQSLRETWRELLEFAHLEDLTICGTNISKDEIDLFFQVCKKIKYLNMREVFIFQLPSNFLNGTDELIFPNIITLHFVAVTIGISPPHSSPYCLGVLTRRCPGLRSLDIGTPYIKKEPPEFFRATFLHHSYTFTNLSSLRLDMKIDDEDMAALLRRMAGLRRLDIPDCEFGPFSLQELLAYEGESLDSGVLVRKRRDRRLCDTIEELLFKRQTERTDGIVQAILSNCPRLKSLWGPKITVTEIVNGAEWVSTDLVRLIIDLEADVDQETAEGMEKQRIVFRRLGKLTRLRELALAGRGSLIAIRTLDLRLRAGLDELVNLKWLYSVEFNYVGHRIQYEEATWIVNNWPRIRYLRYTLINEVYPANKLSTHQLAAELFNSHKISAQNNSDGWKYRYY
ncbi:hypothetical protein BCR41DRAFT_362938 [Lobosporangium transversale]|uniref:F-box domain-containing protein n=1 Tax=Lobosporangium transversale TaxID=64571 RepID=A0A1Y2G8T7_9FUNG|nr:hypothetical protein BCR41DRAFT_362938 [Lobosporangium transversale]ORZ04321.1 hypothetical protein BCR41DRAFT_362938 [Lobosporangium transversale]|eukprot:XP_021876479.1 hypothetical protein BCR41DRAFT_362938 [Lobosporangium transversale]